MSWRAAPPAALDVVGLLPAHCARMRIACPGCAAAYDLPDALLAAGPRELRCARCGAQFRASLPEPEAPEPVAPEPVPVPEPEPVVAAPAPEPPPPAEPPPDRPPPSRGPRHAMPIDPPLPAPEERPEASPRAAIVGWLGSLALIAVAIWAAIIFRAEIIAAWPPAARLFLALGLGSE